MNVNTNNSLDAVSTKGTRSKSANAAAPEAKAPANTPAPAATPKATDQVVLSEQAQTLGRLQSKIDSAPEVNLDKVAEIRRAIAEGRFEINAERIAENMLSQQDLLG